MQCFTPGILPAGSLRAWCSVAGILAFRYLPEPKYVDSI